MTVRPGVSPFQGCSGSYAGSQGVALGYLIEPLRGSAHASMMMARPTASQPMDWRQYITTDPNIMHGAICFAGTRVPVAVVLDNLADGAETTEILRQYPSLRAEHIPAALSFAADLARERVVPIPV